MRHFILKTCFLVFVFVLFFRLSTRAEEKEGYAIIHCFSGKSTIATAVFRFKASDYLITNNAKLILKNAEKLTLKERGFYESYQCPEGARPADVVGTFDLICESVSVQKIDGYCYGEALQFTVR